MINILLLIHLLINAKKKRGVSIIKIIKIFIIKN